MYKAVEIRTETENRLKSLAKGFIMDIVNHRIEEGIYDEDPDGCYVIEPSDNQLRIDVWVMDTYNPDFYIERMVVEGIGIADDVYVIVGENKEEVYLRSLPFNSIIDICCDLEDIYDEEVAE